MKDHLLDYWDDDYEKKAIADGYEDILILAQMYITKYAPELLEKENKPLQKSENKLQQHNPNHRPSKITEDTIEFIKMIREMGHQSCREIAETLYKGYNISIHFTTVSRILKGTYKPMLKNETKV